MDQRSGFPRSNAYPSGFRWQHRARLWEVVAQQKNEEMGTVLAGGRRDANGLPARFEESVKSAESKDFYDFNSEAFRKVRGATIAQNGKMR